MKYAIMSDVHANPFILRMALIDAKATGAALFVGHVHEAKIWEREPDGQIKEICIPPTEEPFHVFDFIPKVGCRYIVNVGSIGRPRDGYAGYVIWDSDVGRLSFHRQRMSQRLPM